MNGLTIGKIAKQVGLGLDTIRFYERQGLIEPPLRTESNYRLYRDKDVVRIRFIKRAKKLGFSLNEIKELLSLRHNPNASKADIKNRTENKIKDIRQRVQDLSKMLHALESLSAACDGQGPIDECPILEALDNCEE